MAKVLGKSPKNFHQFHQDLVRYDFVIVVSAEAQSLTFLIFPVLTGLNQKNPWASSLRLSKKFEKLRRSGHKFVVRGWVGPNLPKPALT